MSIPYPRSAEPFSVDPSSYAGDLAAFEETAKEIGYVIYAWNTLQQNFLILLVAIIGRKNVRVGPAIWNSLKSDSAQRATIIGAAQTLMKQHPLLDEVLWVVREADSLAYMRNDVAHSPFAFSGLLRIPTPDTGFGHPLAKRLAKKNLQQDLREATDYFLTLADYVVLLANHVVGSDKIPLPDKPIRPPSLLAENQKQKNRGLSHRDDQTQP